MDDLWPKIRPIFPSPSRVFLSSYAAYTCMLHTHSLGSSRLLHERWGPEECVASPKNVWRRKLVYFGQIAKNSSWFALPGRNYLIFPPRSLLKAKSYLCKVLCQLRFGDFWPKCSEITWHCPLKSNNRPKVLFFLLFFFFFLETFYWRNFTCVKWMKFVSNI